MYLLRFQSSCDTQNEYSCINVCIVASEFRPISINVPSLDMSLVC